MNRLSLLILIIIPSVFLAISIPFILNPSLYTPEQKSSTLYHQNLLPSTESSYEGAVNIETLEELLDAPYPIVLNIKLKNFKDAKDDFEVYKIKSRQLNDAINTLSLNETTIGNFNTENQKNLIDIEKMITECEEFNEVNRLGILYKSNNNTALSHSLTYKADAILTSFSRTTGQFRQREPDMIEISRQLNLNTTQFQMVDSILEEIINENREEQNLWGLKLPDSTKTSVSGNVNRKEQGENELKPPDSIRTSISLTISPIVGQYGDTLQLTGKYVFPAPLEVTLFLDGSEMTVLQIDNRSGVFSTPLKIGMMRSGKHVAFANAGTILSNLATFSVIPSDTELTLDTIMKKSTSEILCSGSLYAGEIPVTDATVMIFVDNFEAKTARTNKSGFYMTSIKQSVGNHTIQAIFDDTAFPINPSKSRAQYVIVEQSTTSPIAKGVGAGIIILGFLGGISYMIRINTFGWKRGKSQPSASHEMLDRRDMKQVLSEFLLGLLNFWDVLIRYLRRKKTELEITPKVKSGSEDTLMEPAGSSPSLPHIRDILIRYLRRKKTEPEADPKEKSSSEDTWMEPAGSSPGLPNFRDILIRYLQPRKPESEAAPKEKSSSEDTSMEPAESSPGLPDLQDVVIQYQNLSDSGEWSEAAFLLYKYLIRWLIPIHGVKNPSTMTPREFAHMFTLLSTGVSLQSFIARYEEVRYEGLPLQQEDILLTSWKEILARFEVELNDRTIRNQ